MIRRRNPIGRRMQYLVRGNKYGAVKTIFNGRMYDSKGEGRRAADLETLERAGEIRNLRKQVTYDLMVNGITVARYKADFVYEEKLNGKWFDVTEDFKGLMTDVFRIKRKLMKACHGIDIKITTAKDLGKIAP